eukprot:908345_1
MSMSASLTQTTRSRRKAGKGAMDSAIEAFNTSVSTQEYTQKAQANAVKIKNNTSNELTEQCAEAMLVQIETNKHACSNILGDIKTEIRQLESKQKDASLNNNNNNKNDQLSSTEVLQAQNLLLSAQLGAFLSQSDPTSMEQKMQNIVTEMEEVLVPLTLSLVKTMLSERVFVSMMQKICHYFSLNAMLTESDIPSIFSQENDTYVKSLLEAISHEIEQADMKFISVDTANSFCEEALSAVWEDLFGVTKIIWYNLVQCIESIDLSEISEDKKSDIDIFLIVQLKHPEYGVKKQFVWFWELFKVDGIISSLSKDNEDILINEFIKLLNPQIMKRKKDEMTK